MSKDMNKALLWIFALAILFGLFLSSTSASSYERESDDRVLTSYYDDYGYYDHNYYNNYHGEYRIYKDGTRYQRDCHYYDYDCDDYDDDRKHVRYHRNYYGYEDGYYADDSDDYYYFREDDTYTRYDSRASHERYEGIFENEINEYKVKVRNQEREGRYFTIKYHFTDYYGDSWTETRTLYVPAHESKNFVYKNVFDDGKEYKSVRYEIVPYD